MFFRLPGEVVGGYSSTDLQPPGTRRAQAPATTMEKEERNSEDSEKGKQDVDDVDGEAGRLHPALAKLGGVHAGQVVCWAPRA